MKRLRGCTLNDKFLCLIPQAPALDMTASPHPLDYRLRQQLEDRPLLPPGSSGLVMVSGGADSTALLHLLHQLQGVFGWRLRVWHGNHGLRLESTQEQAQVEQQCNALGLPFYAAQASHLKNLPAGWQAAAREWRQGQVVLMHKQQPFDWVATGHQLEDHQETQLLKWLRGTHLSHLRGMESETWQRGLRWVRPLLGFERQELEDWLSQHHIAWSEDPSNTQPKYLRNRVRHELVPILQELTRGGLAQRLATQELQSRELLSMLEEMGDGFWTSLSPTNEPVPPKQLSVELLLEQPSMLMGHLLRQWVVQHSGHPIDSRLVEALVDQLWLGEGRWELHLSHRRLVKCEAGVLTLVVTNGRPLV